MLAVKCSAVEAVYEYYKYIPASGHVGQWDCLKEISDIE